MQSLDTFVRVQWGFFSLCRLDDIELFYMQIQKCNHGSLGSSIVQ